MNDERIEKLEKIIELQHKMIEFLMKNQQPNCCKSCPYLYYWLPYYPQPSTPSWHINFYTTFPQGIEYLGVLT